jgi:phosphoglycerate kinase
MPKLSIRDLDLKGKRIFMRVDFNVPLGPGGQEITSDQRIRASLPSIRYALEQGAQIVLASHLGRPKGRPNPQMSLQPVAKRLAELLGQPVVMAPDCIGAAVDELKRGPAKVILLENVRFHPQEEQNDSEFARQLASGCELYVNDAFGSAHRAHASTVGVIQFLPRAAAGLLMQKELEYLFKVTQDPPRPCVGILGGAKVSDKIEVIRNLLSIVDKLLIGGAMAYTFMKALGRPVGRSLVEDDKLDRATSAMAQAGARLILPVDTVVAPEIKVGVEFQVVEAIPAELMGVDIGPKTVELFAQEIAKARSVIWNGPMGVFETSPFDRGTVAVAKAVAASGALSVVGGGDSEKAVQAAGVADKISHISTGGGASLEFLSGLTLPGVAALSDM